MNITLFYSDMNKYEFTDISRGTFDTRFKSNPAYALEV